MKFKQITHRSLLRYNENIGQLFTPNLNMRKLYSEKPYHIRTNRQGFRSDFDFEKTKKKGEKRIAFLGDSFAAGDGVANEKRFSNLVAEAFGARPYNFGLSGSGVDQQYLVYKNIASQYEHDVLVVSPHIMDIGRNLLDSRLSIDGSTGKEVLVPKPYFTLEEGNLVPHNLPVPRERTVVEEQTSQEKIFSPGPVARKVFHQFVPKKAKEKLLKLQFSKQHGGYESPQDPRWVLMRKLLEEIIALAGERPVILAPLPYHRIGQNPDYQERFVELAGQYDNVHFVDVLEKFKEVPDTDSLHYEKDAHYSEFGHEKVAEAIAEGIVREGLLKPSLRSGSGKSGQTKPSYVLGISAFYHDSGCALIKEGEIVAAAQEERFTRVKNDSGFPHKAINYCLEEAQIDIEEVKAVVFYDHPYRTLERIIASQLSVYPKGEKVWREALPKWVETKLHIPELIQEELNWRGEVHFTNHHLSHAASAFYPSPFTKAAILTVDGVGEWATATIGYGEGNKVELLKEMDFPHSIGLLYSAFTYYTGFKVNEGEYKLMGLAPYGEPVYADLIKEHLVDIQEDGSIKLNLEYFTFREELVMINEEKFEQLFGGPARDPKVDVDKRIRDVARSIQAVTEEVVIKMARHAKKITGADYLCLAGGVALNCVANGKLLREGVFKDIWIQPAAGDAGCALGAALALFYEKYNVNKLERKEGECRQKGSYWGPSFSDGEIKAYLDSHGYQYRELKPEERNRVVAEQLAEQKIVGHFSGRMEFGPRALGARSILGDPRSETAQSTLNLKIKFRESFRPFAPSVLEEDIAEYFDLDRPSPYMVLVSDVQKDRCLPRAEGYEHDLIKIVNQKRSDLPAITHIDYSARVQSVSKESNPVYYDLIQEFKKLTGYGVVINTSFNVNGEPIVCTPKDAVTCFMTTNMDVLVMNNYILFKEEQEERDLEELKFKRPEVKVNEKKVAKVKKQADRLFHEYIPDLAAYKSLFKPFNTRGTSGWTDFGKGKAFDSIHPGQPLHAEEILCKWTVVPERAKPDFLPLLNEIVRLSNKYKLDASEVENTVSRSKYVMD
ncbi:carbamoyltransferase N-terminal domain-containing protein [Nafulsella turpanensis]|uniref:carbamoyltransferase N-terminal domain-containing protein n=1 Tax=Nafulsella turpanensis TaxID=1265690 RepID=UPI00034C621C|nr:carbamoyltransferase N-terminal domain-containing protein [Nafulsella turpanensis]